MFHQTAAIETLGLALRASKNPYVLSSFGKDSLAILDMAATFDVRNVLYLEDRDEVVDASHIARTVERYKLNVVRMPSGRGILYFIDKQPYLLGLPFVNQFHVMPVPTNMDPYVPGEAFTCVDDRLQAHHGEPLKVDVDLLIMGLKRADWESNTCRIVIDKLSAPEKLAFIARFQPIMDVAPGLRTVFPLLEWSHAQVWDYLEAKGIEASSLMYVGRARRPHQNPVCYRCHDPAGPALVECPKTGGKLMNLGHFTKGASGLPALARLGVIGHDDVAKLEG